MMLACLWHAILLLCDARRLSPMANDASLLSTFSSTRGEGYALANESARRTASDLDSPKRLLIYCLQSSGGSTFAKLLAQVTNTVAFIDIGIFVRAADFPSPHSLATAAQAERPTWVIAKATIQGDETGEPLERLNAIQNRFRPHATILFMRNLEQNFVKLSRRSYAGLSLRALRTPRAVDTVCAPGGDPAVPAAQRCGSVAGKIRALQRVWLHGNFAAVVTENDIRQNPERVLRTVRLIGLPLAVTHWTMPKSTTEIVAEAARYYRDPGHFEVGAGRVEEGPISEHHDLPIESDVLSAVRAELKMIGVEHLMHRMHIAQTSVLSDAQAQWLVDQQTRGIVVLTFVDGRYLHTLLNWALVAKRNHAIDRVAVVCMDDVSRLELEALGYGCLRVSFEKVAETPHTGETHFNWADKRSSVWALRMLVASELLERGVDVLLTDTDAMWQKPPWELFRVVNESWQQAHQRPGAPDIISQRGTYPLESLAKWNATLCMGFALLRATEPTRKLLAQVGSCTTHFEASHCWYLRERFYDDQYLINRVLSDDWNIGFEGATGSNESRRLALSRQGDAVGIVLLPNRVAARACSLEDLGEPTVLHCVEQGFTLPNISLLPPEWPTQLKRGTSDALSVLPRVSYYPWS